jgi:hypothetical protein
MRFRLKFVFHPTPEHIKSVSWAIVSGLGGVGSLTALLTPYPKLGAAIGIVGLVASCVCSFMGDEEK